MWGMLWVSGVFTARLVLLQMTDEAVAQHGNSLRLVTHLCCMSARRPLIQRSDALARYQSAYPSRARPVSASSTKPS